MKIMLKISSIAFLVIGTLKLLWANYIMLLTIVYPSGSNYFCSLISDTTFGIIMFVDSVMSVLIGLFGLIARKKKSSMLRAGIILACVNAVLHIMFFFFICQSIELLVEFAVSALFVISGINLRRREKEEINLLK